MAAPDDKHLLLDDGSKLAWLPKQKEFYLNRTTLIFGPPETGKTTLCDEILRLCRDSIPVVFAIAPTNAANGTYTGRIPDSCIRPDLKIDWFNRFITRQKNLAAVYKNSNNPDILRPIVHRIASAGEQKMIDAVLNHAAACLRMLEKSDWTFSKKKAQQDQIIRMRDNIILKTYKNIIRANRAQLLMSDLTTLERGAVEYVNLNPNALIIFDDCAANFKKWCKQTQAFKEMFYNIRWLNLTLIITTQDDKEIDSELRKTSMVQFFTHQQIACANFERGSNFYSKDVRAHAQRCIKAVFDQPKGEPKHHRKLVYIRGNTEPFRYTIADIYDNFQFGSGALWKLAGKQANKDEAEAERNPFFKNLDDMR